MKILFIQTVILFSFACANAASASSNDDIALKRSCSGQIMGTVQSAHQAPNGPLKKVIFSKSKDAEFIALAEKLDKLMEEANGKPTPDKETLQKMNDAFDKAGVLAQKSAGKEMNLCLAWMGAMMGSLPSVCPNYEEDFKSEEKKNKCLDAANAVPAVSAKSEAWKSAFMKLVLAEKKK